MRRSLLCLFLLQTTLAPAWAQAFAHDMTCAQAIEHYETTGIIFVMANDRFAVPIRNGIPINQAATLHCPDQGQSPRPQTVSTRDVSRCVIAVYC